MHLPKGKKSLAYIFLLILFGSIHNFSLNNIKFEKIKNIKVTGLDDFDRSIIKKKISSLNLGNIFFIDASKINQTMEASSQIEKYIVYKNYPSTLNIKVEKTNFLAKINSEGKIFLIGSNGKLTKGNFFEKELPFIFGKPKLEEFLNFKKIIDQSRFEYKQIENFYFYPSKRWDLALKNNIILKLPQKNIQKSLNNSFEFIKDSNFKNVKVIDARIQNQIILND